jgi:hypothetical protein
LAPRGLSWIEPCAAGERHRLAEVCLIELARIGAAEVAVAVVVTVAAASSLTAGADFDCPRASGLARVVRTAPERGPLPVRETAIVYPVLVQVLLTFAVLILLGPARGRSMREARQRLTDSDVELGRNRWSDEALKISNNYKNQFELPVLFYAACALALILRHADPVMVGLAWAFAASRLVHAAIHIGPNIVRWRGLAFLVGAVALLAMWLRLAWRAWGGV